MKKLCFHFFLMLFVSLFITACSNNSATDNTPANEEVSETSLAWNLGVALYSVNLFPFSVSLEKADSAGVKFVEGFSLHALKGEFKDTTMVNLLTCMALESPARLYFHIRQSKYSCPFSDQTTML